MSPPGNRREPLEDTKCPPAAQRKHAKRACIYTSINRVLIVRIGQHLCSTLYICNELIEETAGRRKLIFGMWEFLAIAPVSSELRRKC